MFTVCKHTGAQVLALEKHMTSRGSGKHALRYLVLVRSYERLLM